MKNIFRSRFALLGGFITFYLAFAFIVRLILLIQTPLNFSENIAGVLFSFATGFLFDLCVSLSFAGVYVLYLLVFPSKFAGSKVDKILTWFILGLTVFVALFAFAAEFPFWDEFKSRFNFIAVDYLIYTYEVVANINQSYPIPLIVCGLLIALFLIVFLSDKLKLTKFTFTDKPGFVRRLTVCGSLILLGSGLLVTLTNKTAEKNQNVYLNEIGKNGVFSFFSALKSNELDYHQFYRTMPEKNAYTLLKKELLQKDNQYTDATLTNITRHVTGTQEGRPNIILICIESFSADFLKAFGNKESLTPNYEGLAERGLFFTNMFATGTRTVRGMEALTLCVPPTPGNSIVRRSDNDHLASDATILRAKNYNLDFIYGGDGYFDNMNAFFGGQCFTIVDRNRGNPLPENIHTPRIGIEDSEVTFENAWGICDEDIYRKTLKISDQNSKTGKPFFEFIMTTSNHKPYTFPAKSLNAPQGSRESAVKYTDYALGKFMAEAAKKSWFAHTVFVVVADHCANSAGKWEINTEKHHIPALIFGHGITPRKVNKLASQIDLMPTLFSMLGWSYDNAMFGKNILKMKPDEERALIGNYRTLGLLKNNIFTQINDRHQLQQFSYDSVSRKLSGPVAAADADLANLTVAYYQTASDRFSKGLMKEKSAHR